MLPDYCTQRDQDQTDLFSASKTSLLMAASVMNIIPPVILFVTCQKFLVKGIQLGAVKG